MGFLYQLFVNSSKESVMDKLNKCRFGRAHIVYSAEGKILELSRKTKIKPWEEDKIYSAIPEIKNIVEQF